MQSPLTLNTANAWAQLSESDGVLTFTAPGGDSLTAQFSDSEGQPCLRLLANERELFQGTDDALTAGMEAVRALIKLRGNAAFTRCLESLSENLHAQALLVFLRIR